MVKDNLLDNPLSQTLRKSDDIFPTNSFKLVLSQSLIFTDSDFHGLLFPPENHENVYNDSFVHALIAVVV